MIHGLHLMNHLGVPLITLIIEENYLLLWLRIFPILRTSFFIISTLSSVRQTEGSDTGINDGRWGRNCVCVGVENNQQEYYWIGVRYSDRQGLSRCSMNCIESQSSVLDDPLMLRFHGTEDLLYLLVTLSLTPKTNLYWTLVWSIPPFPTDTFYFCYFVLFYGFSSHYISPKFPITRGKWGSDPKLNTGFRLPFTHT